MESIDQRLQGFFKMQQASDSGCQPHFAHHSEHNDDKDENEDEDQEDDDP